MPAPVNRTALFDPGVMSEQSLDVSKLEYLDDIVITHIHPDHLSMDLVKKLVAKFPEVQITSTPEVVELLKTAGIKASTEAPEGMEFFDSPHEALPSMAPVPQQIGVHYLDKLSHPGDSHSFDKDFGTKAILAMPMTAPWGSMVKAVNIILELKPQHVIPIHDWHWRPEALQSMYPALENLFKEKGITFHNLVDGEPIVLDV
jgi:L-ascorbate metabolism protein UlaG (beta-lactamase superfamily)